MLQLVKNLLTTLGLNLGGVPDILIVVVVIIVIIVTLRIVQNILESLLSVGCIVIAIIVITALVLEVF